MQTSNLSPVSETTDAVQSLIGQTFAGTVSDKTDGTLIIAIADPNGAQIPVPGILPKDGLIGFTPIVKETRFTRMESGNKLCVRIVAVDLNSPSPSVQLSEVSSLQ